MRYLSVCSGIEAATVAWHPLGWQAVGYAEVDRFPSAVLAHHYPAVPNYGDLTQFRKWPDATLDVLVGGTPCQSFSVAGLRAGLADPRGNLALTYLAVADRYRPEWVVWENVPGVLSADDGGALGAFLGGLGELGYGWAYRSLDAQYFGLAQRRMRVFVVGHLGDWRRAAAVLFERESLSGHPAPRREAGQDVAGTVTGGASSGGHGRFASADAAAQGLLIPSTGDVSHCLNAGGMGRIDYETETLITHSLRADGFDASEDGTGRGTPIIPIDLRCTSRGAKMTNNRAPGAASGGAAGTGIGKTGDPAFTVSERGQAVGVMAFTAKDYGADAGALAPTLRAGGFTNSHANGGVMPAIQSGMQVRRLTPRECERLQGFPDDYTLIPYRGKPAADGPRYKALGNSMAVPCMAWIGRRIAMVQALGEALDVRTGTD